ncbi:MAG TPA: PQQ-binding-like beta-propeller repeat protein [Ignavibacteriaceae bacterium]|nr:PQQ-binding-like beta-propeller repeat protein [Ignavibacteriaceae bacterium]
MKKLIIVLLLTIINLFPQTYKYAWLSDIHIGAPSATNDVRNVINDINKRNDLSFVVMTGDITERGFNWELDSSKMMFDLLKLPYHIIPGNHDVKWSESGLNKFIELYNDDKFLFENGNTVHIGISSGVPMRSHGGHIASEYANWVFEKLSKYKDSGKEIIFYEHHPLDAELDNVFKITNVLNQFNVKAVLVGHGHANRFFNANGLDVVMGRSTLNRKEGWGYTVVEDSKDSLSFFINNNGKENFWYSIQKNKERKPVLIDTLQFINYNAKILWNKNFDEIVTVPILYKDNYLVYPSFRGVIRVLNLNGNEQWHYDVQCNIISKPYIYKNKLFCGTTQGELLIFDVKSGKLKETISIGSSVTSQLTVFTDTDNIDKLLIGTTAGILYCYDANTLELLWENHSSQKMIETRPIYTKKRILFGSWDNYLFCLDSQTGKLNWKWTENPNFYYSPAAVVPLVNDKSVFVASPDRHVSSIDLITGKTNWREKLNCWESLGISNDGNYIYCKTFEKKFLIANASDGKVYKEFNIDNLISDTMPTEIRQSKSGDVLFGIRNGMVYNVDKDYKTIQSILFEGSSRVHTIQELEDGSFICTNMDGSIIRFRLNNEKI